MNRSRSDKRIGRAARADVGVRRAGGLYLFVPYTPAAETWIKINAPDATLYAGAVAVEQRYAIDLALGMLSDGLELH